MGTSDIVRWARNCPWWVRKPRLEGSTLVPAGSPGMCRVVMLAPPAAVKTMLKRRDPSLCIVLEETPAVSYLRWLLTRWIFMLSAAGVPLESDGGIIRYGLVRFFFLFFFFVSFRFECCARSVNDTVGTFESCLCFDFVYLIMATFFNKLFFDRLSCECKEERVTQRIDRALEETSSFDSTTSE